MTDDAGFRRKAVSGAGWVAVDKWSNRIMGLVVLAVLGRLLSPADFGLVAIATAFMAFAAVFVDQGFGRALIQRVEVTRDHRDTALWISLLSSVVIAGVMVGAAPLLAAAFGSSAELVPVIQVLSAGLVVNALSSTPAALLEREFRFRALAIRRLASTMVGGVTAVVAALCGLGVWSLVIQALVTAMVGLVALWASAGWMPRPRVSMQAVRDLWRVGVSIIGIELVGLLNSQADRLLIGAFLSPTALGYYFMAIRIVSIMVELFSSVFSGISLSAFSRLQDDRPRLRAWFYKLTSMSSTVALPVFALATVTAPVMLPFVFGQQWSGSVPVFQILCFLGALNAVAYFDRSILIAVGKARAAFLLTLGQTVLGIALVLVSLPFGVIAVSVAVTARQYLYWPVRLWVLRKNIGIAPGRYLVQWLRPFLVSVVAIGVFAVFMLVFPRLQADLPAVFVIVAVVVVTVVFVAGIWIVQRSFFDDLKRVLRRQL